MVPWAQILSRPDGFYLQKYLPENIQLREPSKLKKTEVDNILDFWKARENRNADPVFQFHHTLNWKGELVDAIGGEEDVESDAAGKDSDIGSTESESSGEDSDERSVSDQSAIPHQ